MTTVTVGHAADLGPALRRVRHEEALSQSALADVASVGRQWLNAFEAGDKPSAPMDMVLRVARALDATIVLTPAAVPSRSPRTDDLVDDLVDLDDLVDQADSHGR